MNEKMKRPNDTKFDLRFCYVFFQLSEDLDKKVITYKGPKAMNDS